MNRIISKIVRVFEVVASKILPLSLLYIYPYKNVVKRELQLADIPPKSRVLQIGAGSIPYTAMYLAKIGDLYVTAIDKDPIAVKHARRWIKRMGIADKVDVILTKGDDYPLSNISAVFIALQVEPKDEVLKYIMEKGQKGLKVIIREPSKRYKSQYDPIPKKWTPFSKVHQGVATFTYSNLYIKS